MIPLSVFKYRISQFLATLVVSFFLFQLLFYVCHVDFGVRLDTTYLLKTENLLLKTLLQNNF